MTQHEATAVPEASLVAYEPIAPLVSEVTNTCAEPVNRLQVTAILESAGVTDAIARRRYGYADVFDLAETVADRIGDKESAPKALTLLEPASENWKATLADYGRGPLGLLPLILLTVIINVYQNFGQWDNSQILTLSISTVGSLLVTGGFVQIAARKGSSYLSQGYIRAAARVITQVMVICAIVVVLSGVLLTFGGGWLGWIEPADQPLMLIAYITLSSLWLFSAVLAIINKVQWFGIGLGIGVAGSYGSLQLLSRTLLLSHIVMLIATAIGVGIAIGVMTVIIRRTLRLRQEASPVGEHRAILAPLPQLIVNLAPYFAYGVTYVICVLAGHIGGWIGKLPSGMERIQGLALSELALTIALTGFILVGGVSESTMRRFWERVNGYQKATLAETPEQFTATLWDFIRKERRRFLSALTICSGLILAIVIGLVMITPDRELLGMKWNADTIFIFVSGLIGYGLLALGVFYCMFAITLSRPLYALATLGIGMIATLSASILCGVLISYAYGALGIIIGSFIFVMVARHYLSHIIKYADYYYYSSF